MSLATRLGFLLAVLALAAVGRSAPAHADPPTYTVSACAGSAPIGADFEFGAEGLNSPPEDPTFATGCGGGPAVGVYLGSRGIVESGGGTVPPHAFRRWTLFAPPGTLIEGVGLFRESIRESVPSNSFLYWDLFTDHQLLDEEKDDGRAEVDILSKSFSHLQTGFVTGRLRCPFPTQKCSGGRFAVRVSISIALGDLAPPQLFGPVVNGGSLQGTVNIGYAATSGPGIANAALIVDDVERPVVHDDNGGKCQQPYKYLAPCRSNVSASLPLDTTTLAEGQHNVKVVVEDAAGVQTVSNPVTVTVHNAPIALFRPTLAGIARVGGQISATTGVWEGATSFAFRWLRCPATLTTAGDTTGCAPIQGAASRQYAPVAADFQHRLLVEVTATNASGSASEVSPPSEVIAEAPPPPPPPPPPPSPPPPPHQAPPVLSRLSLSHKRFRVQDGVTKAKGHGALLSFTSNEPGHLVLVIERLHRGHKPKRVATLAAAIKRGRSSVVLNGMVGKRRLAPGPYRVTLTVRDSAGEVSAPVHSDFTILRG